MPGRGPGSRKDRGSSRTEVRTVVLDDTTADVATRARRPAVTVLRRVAVVVLLLAVLAGAVGLLGVRTGTTTARGDGYELTVTYPRTARAGLDAAWGVDLTAPPGGFGDQIVLAVRSDYFDFWEEQGFSPEPSAETSDATYDYMTFDPPPGNEFSLSFDGYVQPGSQRGGDGEVAVLVDGRRAVAAGFSTWLAP